MDQIHFLGDGAEFITLPRSLRLETPFRTTGNSLLMFNESKEKKDEKKKYFPTFCTFFYALKIKEIYTQGKEKSE